MFAARFPTRTAVLARVYLTDVGRELVLSVDKAWKRLEREAMSGLEDKDRKKLRKLLRQVEKNLSISVDDDPEHEADFDTDGDEVAEAEAKEKDKAKEKELSVA